jgi:hypothetical protein
LWRVFQDRISWTICLGWLWTAILLISVSWVARIRGVSHQCLVIFWILILYLLNKLVKIFSHFTDCLLFL